jgi:hypothetical protein
MQSECLDRGDLPRQGLLVLHVSSAWPLAGHWVRQELTKDDTICVGSPDVDTDSVHFLDSHDGL